jgi:hypothetical protein
MGCWFPSGPEMTVFGMNNSQNPHTASASSYYKDSKSKLKTQSTDSSDGFKQRLQDSCDGDAASNDSINAIRALTGDKPPECANTSPAVGITCP